MNLKLKELHLIILILKVAWTKQSLRAVAKDQEVAAPAAVVIATATATEKKQGKKTMVRITNQR